MFSTERTLLMLGYLMTAVFFLALILRTLFAKVDQSHSWKGLNCAAPPRVPARSILFGLDTIYYNLQQVSHKCRTRSIFTQHLSLGPTFESFPLTQRVISTIDARNVQFVFTQNEKFGVAPIREKAQGPMTGKGVITSDGEEWSSGRSMIRPTFTRTQIADSEMFERHVGRLVKIMHDVKGVFDLQPLFDRLILDASSEFIFGESFNSQADCKIDSKAFLESFDYAQKGVGIRVLLGKMSFLNRDKKFWSSCDLLRQYTQRHVEKALDSRKSSRTNSGSDDKFETRSPAKYTLVYELAKETSSIPNLTSQLLNVFFAGRDTPAVALSNTFFCIARNPNVWSKIRSEVSGLKPLDLTFEKLKSLRYTQHCISEALRLYPPVPNNSRACLADTTLPYGGGPDGTQPVAVQKGDRISMAFYTMNRNAAVFGPDPESYNPERWTTIRPGWDYLPFGGGARHCPAQQLALFWVAYTITRIAIEFRKVRCEDQEKEFVERLKLNMESGNGVLVSLDM